MYIKTSWLLWSAMGLSEDRDRNINELRLMALLAKPAGANFVPEIYGVSLDVRATIIIQDSFLLKITLARP